MYLKWFGTSFLSSSSLDNLLLLQIKLHDCLLKYSCQFDISHRFILSGMSFIDISLFQTSWSSDMRHNDFLWLQINLQDCCLNYLVSLVFAIDSCSVEFNYWYQFIPNFLISFHHSWQFNIDPNQNTRLLVKFLFLIWHFHRFIFS